MHRPPDSHTIPLIPSIHPQPTTILSAICLAGLPAMAGTTITAIQPAPAAAPWSCNVSLYGWGESLSGDAGVRGYDLPLDISFNELVESLDFAAMGTMELGYEYKF